jgi:hypothetical protein
MGGIPDVLGFGRISTGALHTACVPRINSRYSIWLRQSTTETAFTNLTTFPSLFLRTKISTSLASESPPASPTSTHWSPSLLGCSVHYSSLAHDLFPLGFCRPWMMASWTRGSVIHTQIPQGLYPCTWTPHHRCFLFLAAFPPPFCFFPPFRLGCGLYSGTAFFLFPARPRRHDVFTRTAFGTGLTFFSSGREWRPYTLERLFRRLGWRCRRNRRNGPTWSVHGTATRLVATGWQCIGGFSFTAASHHQLPYEDSHDQRGMRPDKSGRRFRFRVLAKTRNWALMGS